MYLFEFGAASFHIAMCVGVTEFDLKKKNGCKNSLIFGRDSLGLDIARDTKRNNHGAPTCSSRCSYNI